MGKIYVYKQCFSYPANEPLVGTLLTIGDVNDIFAMGIENRMNVSAFRDFRTLAGTLILMMFQKLSMNSELSKIFENLR